MLDEFVAANRGEIIRRCQAKAETRSAPARPTDEPDRGIPLFLDQLLDELRHGRSAGADIATTATQHGRDLLMRGYSVAEVVHDYGNVCQAVTDLAVERNAVISTDDFRTLNRCLDDAIAGAVTEYGRERDPLNAGDEAVDGVRRGRLGRDLLKAIQIARFAFEAIRSGKVGVAGSTGTVLGLGLTTANDLAERLVADR
jgi:hypothetical protein